MAVGAGDQGLCHLVCSLPCPSNSTLSSLHHSLESWVTNTAQLHWGTFPDDKTTELTQWRTVTQPPSGELRASCGNPVCFVTHKMRMKPAPKVRMRFKGYRYGINKHKSQSEALWATIPLLSILCSLPITASSRHFSPDTGSKIITSAFSSRAFIVLCTPCNFPNHKLIRYSSKRLKVD